eukprot:s822_g8.t1
MSLYSISVECWEKEDASDFFTQMRDMFHGWRPCALALFLLADSRCAAVKDAYRHEASGLLQTDASRRVVRIDSQGDSRIEEEALARPKQPVSDESGKPSRQAKTATSKVGINLSVKWMKQPLPVSQAIAAIPRIQDRKGRISPGHRCSRTEQWIACRYSAAICVAS